jgi:hypothetical protein
MPHCVRCGKETELYEAGVPVCTACIDERDRKGYPKKQHIHHEEGDSSEKG